MWAGANTQISTIALGTLGASVFRLSLRDSFITILFFNLFTTLPVALFSTFGKSSGLRQLVVSRYSFGQSFPLFCFSSLTSANRIGRSLLPHHLEPHRMRRMERRKQHRRSRGLASCRTGFAYTAPHRRWSAHLSARNDDDRPLWIPVRSSLSCGWTSADGRCRHVHYFEKYASWPIMVVFVIILGQAAGQVTVDNSGESSSSFHHETIIYPIPQSRPISLRSFRSEVRSLDSDSVGLPSRRITRSTCRRTLRRSKSSFTPISASTSRLSSSKPSVRLHHTTRE